MVAQLLAYFFTLRLRDIIGIRQVIDVECRLEVPLDMLVIHTDGIFSEHAVGLLSVRRFLVSLEPRIYGFLHALDEVLHLLFILCPVLIDNGNGFHLPDFVGLCPTVEYRFDKLTKS